MQCRTLIRVRVIMTPVRHAPRCSVLVSFFFPFPIRDLRCVLELSVGDISCPPSSDWGEFQNGRHPRPQSSLTQWTEKPRATWSPQRRDASYFAETSQRGEIPLTVGSRQIIAARLRPRHSAPALRRSEPRPGSPDFRGPRPAPGNGWRRHPPVRGTYGCRYGRGTRFHRSGHGR